MSDFRSSGEVAADKNADKVEQLRRRRAELLGRGLAEVKSFGPEKITGKSESDVIREHAGASQDELADILAHARRAVPRG